MDVPAKREAKIDIRLDAELAERVRRAAAAEDRSMASYARLALLERLVKQEKTA